MVPVTDSTISCQLLTENGGTIRRMYNGSCSQPEISNVFICFIVNKSCKINQSSMQAYSEMSLAYHRCIGR